MDLEGERLVLLLLLVVAAVKLRPVLQLARVVDLEGGGGGGTSVTSDGLLSLSRPSAATQRAHVVGLEGQRDAGRL